MRYNGSVRYPPTNLTAPGPRRLAPTKLSLKWAHADAVARSSQWTALCDRYAPHPDNEEMWRYSGRDGRGAAQGWKLHLSATLPYAVDLFERCAPILQRSGCSFKVASSPAAIVKLNVGTAGRSQIGKIITVYCPDPEKGRALAEELHIVTRGLPGPVVPSDRQFRPQSNVFYRYGGYDRLEVELDGRMAPAYRDPSGKPVHDKRTKATAVPDWVVDPFVDASLWNGAPQRRTKGARYVAFKWLGWRGRGGVYLARRREQKTLQLYVIKEGLRHGGVGPDGRGGVHRVRQEFRVLKRLNGIVPTPAPIEFFYQDGNAYLVTEFIDGKNIDEVLGDGELPLETKISIARQMVDIVASLHAAGWCWRDCKSGNFLYRDGKVWAIDFELAGRVHGRPTSFEGTNGYFLEYKEVSSGRAGELQDLYGLGTTLHRIMTGLTDEKAMALGALPPLSDGIPPAIRDMIAALRHEVPHLRASAAATRRVFDRLPEEDKRAPRGLPVSAMRGEELVEFAAQAR
jgi:hypothetical protein